MNLHFFTINIPNNDHISCIDSLLLELCLGKHMCLEMYNVQTVEMYNIL